MLKFYFQCEEFCVIFLDCDCFFGVWIEISFKEFLILDSKIMKFAKYSSFSFSLSALICFTKTKILLLSFKKLSNCCLRRQEKSDCCWKLMQSYTYPCLSSFENEAQTIWRILRHQRKSDFKASEFQTFKITLFYYDAHYSNHDFYDCLFAFSFLVCISFRIRQIFVDHVIKFNTSKTIFMAFLANMSNWAVFKLWRAFV